MTTTSVTYLRDTTLQHVCSKHFTRYQCLQTPWLCSSHCGTDIKRNQRHRHADYGKPECVVCIYMRYELEKCKERQ